MEKVRYRLGIDIGGTFTDFTLVDLETNTTVGIKTPTVPMHPDEGIRKGISILKNEYGMVPENVEYFVHGMTIGLNTLLQRKGSKLALFVTEGFRDILTMQRMRLPVPFDIHSHLPKPLIGRNMVFGIKERMLADGSEHMPLDTASLKAACESAIAEGAEGIAICFLHSYRNPKHEREAAEWISSNYPSLKCCTSSELWPEIREYERACIAIVNLYIQKNVKTYFEDLKKMLKEEGVPIEPFITQSNGGIMNIDAAAEAPVKTLFSGPAAGVIGAIRVAEISGEKNLLTFDVGGTSTDVSVVIDGHPTFAQSSQLAGFPVNVPTIDIISIGAGGGSIGWLDNGGLLKLGPESAGSDPGPACYGKSELATLTDAFLLCGYVNGDRFAAGRMKLSAERSKAAIGKIAAELGQDVMKTADQMIQVAVSNMYVELSNVMEQKGFDPRELSVVAYGGGGPVTANFVAEEIHAKNVFVPYRPGTLCAMGSLTADFAYDAVLPVNFLVSGITPEMLKTQLAKLEDEARAWLGSQHASVLEGAETRLSYLADARYKGQAYEIQFAIDDAMVNAGSSALAEAFHDQHHLRYGHAEKQADIEIVSLRARIEAATPELPVETIGEGGELKPYTHREIIIRGQVYDAAVYERKDIKAGNVINGPAIVEQDDTTVLILPDWVGSCDIYGNMTIVRTEEGKEA